MDLAGNKVCVVGLGRSALGAVRLLLHQGAKPFVTDAAEGPQLTEYIIQLEALGVPCETGGHSEGAFDNAAAIIVSPGVPPSIEPLCTARAQNIPVIGELEFAFRDCRSKILAVSGTNGKTTTTELLRHMIANCGHSVALAGNNDTPLSDVVMMDHAPEFVVVEVSSYQLESCHTFRPWIAAMLNLTPDHLGRHGNMKGYASVKEGLFAQQREGDVAVINADDPWLRKMALPEDVRKIGFSLKGPVDDGIGLAGDRIVLGGEALARVDDNPLPGRHNLANTLAALAMAHAANLPREGVLAGLRGFAGVEHRIEFVVEAAGVRYYNDSKSTNIDSLRVALESFDRPVVLIAGGRGKGVGYENLRDLVKSRVKTMITMGEDALLLEQAFRRAATMRRADGMAEAVAFAQEEAAAGDVVLLSPGCASFDAYANSEERGVDFKKQLHKRLGRKARRKP